MFVRVNEKKLYTCKSPNLMNFLKNEGHDYFWSDIDESDGKRYWSFVKSPLLQKSLDAWSSNNPNKYQNK